jgi:hypothetical protein
MVGIHVKMTMAVDEKGVLGELGEWGGLAFHINILQVFSCN